MNKEKYEFLINSNEEKHWWPKGRQEIIETIFKYIKEQNTEKALQILELGCGTGDMLKIIQKYGEVKAIEGNDEIAEYAKSKNPSVKISKGFLPEIDFEDESFDLICAFDVVEHIEDDKLTIENIYKKLKKDGKCFLTVPAFQFLFSNHDKDLNHFRRYNKKKLTALFQQDKFKIDYITYFNYYLFPLELIYIMLQKLFNLKNKAQNKNPHKILNNLFYNIFSHEKNKMINSSFPYGLSLMIIATKI